MASRTPATIADRERILRELRTIPGIGRSIAEDLWQLGIRSVSDLRGRDPEQLYRQSCEIAGVEIDRCLLYTYRCAVYFATEKKHDPALLKWWNWKERSI